MAGPARTIRLELWLEGDSPNGRAVTPGAAPMPFAGWLALVAAIDSLARSGERPGQAEEPSGEA